MKFTLAPGELLDFNEKSIILGITEESELTQTGKVLDKLSHGLILGLLKNKEFQAKCGQICILRHCPAVPIKHILLVGLGKSLSLSPKDYRKVTIAAIKAISNEEKLC